MISKEVSKILNSWISKKDLQIIASNTSYNLQIIWHLTKRDISIMFKRSALGLLWTFLLPIAQLIIFIFIFDKVIKISIENYPIFLTSALIPWNWFSTCMFSAGGIFFGNRDLVLKPGFNPILVIIVNVLTNFLLSMAALPILFILFIFSDLNLTINLIYLPILFIIQFVLIFGLQLTIATLNVIFADTQHLVNIFITLLFFLTPVFYQVPALGSVYNLVFDFNIMAVLIKDYRLLIYSGSAPTWIPLVYIFSIGIIISVVAIVLFKSQYDNIIDKI